MEKIKNEKLAVKWDCTEDCVYSRYTLSVSDKQILERTSTGVFFQFPGFAVMGTNEMLGNDFTQTSWYNMGEYVKDVDDILLPREPLLDQKFPRPVMERGYCSGIWSTIDDNDQNKRDCNEEYPQPLSAFGSDKILKDRQKNIFKVAMYYTPDESVITRI